MWATSAYRAPSSKEMPLHSEFSFRGTVGELAGDVWKISGSNVSNGLVVDLPSAEILASPSHCPCLFPLGRGTSFKTPAKALRFGKRKELIGCSQWGRREKGWKDGRKAEFLSSRKAGTGCVQIVWELWIFRESFLPKQLFSVKTHQALKLISYSPLVILKVFITFLYYSLYLIFFQLFHESLSNQIIRKAQLWSLQEVLNGSETLNMWALN